MDTQKEDGRNCRRQRPFQLPERLKPFACEPLGQKREERRGLGRRQKLVHRVDDEPFYGLGSEHPCELRSEPCRNLVDEVLLVVRKVS